MRCVVIDDEPIAAAILARYIERTEGLELAASFNDPRKAARYLVNDRVDLVFLDIQMPYMDGLSLLESLEWDPAVIFTTAFPRYAVKSYDMDAIDYLLKPIEYERFLKAVGKAVERGSSPDRSRSRAGSKRTGGIPGVVMLRSGRSLRKLYLEDILYVRAEGNYSCFVTGQGEIMVLMPMKDVEGSLPADLFARVHRSYLVSLPHVEAAERGRVRVGGKYLPVSRSRRKALKERLDGFSG